jgi:pimeloyl-ACP methyl ester carboxylesterase
VTELSKQKTNASQSPKVRQVKNVQQIRERLIQSNGIELHVEERGDPKAPPVLLVMGLGCQMTVWPETLLQLLVDRGYRVIRFDNRDIGLSSKMEGKVRTPIPLAYARYKIGLPVTADYTLHDMAADIRGLMDALDLERANLVGVSMGGMISQILTAGAPERVNSLSLLMTSNNCPSLPLPDLQVMWRINGGGIRGHDIEAARARALAFWKTAQSPAYPMSREHILNRVETDYHRSYRPSGITRQMRAILATGSVEKYSRQILVPTQIIHGAADPLIKIGAAHKLAGLIPSARLEVIHGMGHDLPGPLLPRIADLIDSNIQRAQPAR